MVFARCRNIFKIYTIALMFRWGFIEGAEEHKLNLKIGFDVVPSADGNPSVRIRDFEDFNLRKMVRKPEEISVRGDETSPETEEHKDEAKDDKSSDAVANQESSESEENALRSTKGIHPDEFEPETHARLHLGKQSDTESDER